MLAIGQRLNVCRDIFHAIDLKKISMVPGEDCNAMIAIFAYKAIWNYALSLKLRFYPWNYAFILEIKLLSLKLRLYLRLHPWNYTFILEITFLSLKLRLYPWNYAFILEITQLYPIEYTILSLKLALILEITLLSLKLRLQPLQPLSMFLFPFLPEYVKVMVPQMSLA